jgi:seryl-tRNA synthetase
LICLQKKENADDKIAQKAVIEAEIIESVKVSDALEKERDTKLKLIGNIVHDSVPVSNNEVCILLCYYLIIVGATGKNHEVWLAWNAG